MNKEDLPDSVRALEKFIREADAAVRKLLYEECSLLLECRFCRGFFRTFHEFILHKMTYCTNAAVVVAIPNRGPIPLAREDSAKPEQVAVARKVGGRKSAKRAETILKPAEDTPAVMDLFTLSRDMRELPSIPGADGSKKVVGGASLARALSSLQSVPADRTAVALPADNSARYQAMLARDTENSSDKTECGRDLFPHEVKIIEAFEKADVRCGDFVSIRCDHPSCTHLRLFDSLQALAYHCSLRHTKKNGDEGGWPCLLCPSHMPSLVSVEAHMAEAHSDVKDLHLRMRMEKEKMGKGGKKNTRGRRRSRSLSLDSDAVAKRDAKEEQEDGSGLIPADGQPTRRDRNADRNASGVVDVAVSMTVLVTRAVRKKVSKKSIKKLARGGWRKTVGGEEEVAVQQEGEEDYEKAVEECVTDLVSQLCGEEEEREAKADKNSSADSSPLSDSSASKKVLRGRPRKSSITSTATAERRASTDKPAARSKRASSGPAKRAYVKKADREKLAAELAKRNSGGGGAETTPSSEHSSQSGTAAADATRAPDASRPVRQRKRPSWMLNADEVFEGAGGAKTEGAEETAKGQSNAVESAEEGEEKPKELKKKKEKKPSQPQPVTPVKNEPRVEDPRVEEVLDENKQKILLYTPRAGKHVTEKKRAAEAPTNKRKQNLANLEDDEEELKVVSTEETSESRRSAIDTVPVLLSEHQQKTFFSGLIHHMAQNIGDKEYYQCEFCEAKMPNIRDGRRHMVAHVRALRLRCGLCGAGAFFGIDMRNHLQLGACPKLADAPAGYVRPGQPCMTKAHADELTVIVHAGNALVTSGKIVSIISDVPYVPDPVIEELLLGPIRAPPRHPSAPLQLRMPSLQLERSVFPAASAFSPGPSTSGCLSTLPPTSAAAAAPPTLEPMVDAAEMKARRRLYNRAPPTVHSPSIARSTDSAESAP